MLLEQCRSRLYWQISSIRKYYNCRRCYLEQQALGTGDGEKDIKCPGCVQKQVGDLRSVILTYIGVK
jgi:hypothetical protein